MSIVTIMVDFLLWSKFYPMLSTGYLEQSQTIFPKIKSYGILLVLTSREATSVYESLNPSRTL